MPSSCPVKHAAPAEKESTSSDSGGGNNTCPYRHDKGQRPTTSMPANSELPPNQRPTPGQRKLLSTERVQSTIPRSEGDDTWQYPSQQMFYNAMKRKGYAPSEDDMDSVVAIHNAVNERTWQEILKWEKAHCEDCPTPKLLRFQGRPADLSPKVSECIHQVFHATQTFRQTVVKPDTVQSSPTHTHTRSKLPLLSDWALTTTSACVHIHCSRRD